MKDKKGSARDVLLIGVLLFSLAVAAVISHYTMNTFADTMLNITEINESNATAVVLTATKEATDRLDYVVFGFFIALTLALLITSYFMAGNVIFMFIYFIVIVIGVILSAIMSNVWEDIGTLSVLGTTITTSFPIANHIMAQLPIYIAVIGIIGMVIMFAKPTIGRESI